MNGGDFDPLGDPLAQLDAMRAAGHRLFTSAALNGARLVLRRDDVQRVLGDHETFSSVAALGGPLAQSNPPEVVQAFPGFLSRGDVAAVVDVDPPGHDPLRRLLLRAWSGPRINRLTPRIEASAQELLDDLEDQEELDLVTQYALPLVQRVIAMILGVPDPDREAVAGWGGDIAALITPIVPAEEKVAAARRLHEYEVWAGPFVDARRTEPHDDVIGVYAYGDADADIPAMPRDIVLHCLLVHFVAGTVTSRHAIVNAAEQLLRDRGRWDRAVADPSGLAAAALEEALRFAAPHRGLVRVATRDTDVAGDTVPAGTVLIPMLGSANRDEDHFEDADRFRLDRHNARDHLAFGFGIHGCVGAHLARHEGRIALTTLLTRWPALECAEASRPPAPDYFFHGPDRLLVRRSGDAR